MQPKQNLKDYMSMSKKAREAPKFSGIKTKKIMGGRTFERKFITNLSRSQNVLSLIPTRGGIVPLKYRCF